MHEKGIMLASPNDSTRHNKAGTLYHRQRQKTPFCLLDLDPISCRDRDGSSRLKEGVLDSHLRFDLLWLRSGARP